jgi:hypothetical protein
MLPHPIVQALLAWIREGVSPTAADPAELNAEPIAQQAPEGAS